jgi:MoaD family protein
VPPLRVKVEYLGYLRNLLDLQREEEIEIQEGASVADLLSMLTNKHGGPFTKNVYEPGGSDVKSNFIVTVNRFLLNQLEGLDTKLKHGDRIAFLTVISGG